MTPQPIVAQPIAAQPIAPDHGMSFIGVDVAKDEVVIASGGQLQTVSNIKRNLVSWLKTLPAPAMIGLEATNCYHQLLADLACAAGHTVYVLNPKALKHYRTATSPPPHRHLGPRQDRQLRCPTDRALFGAGAYPAPSLCATDQDPAHSEHAAAPPRYHGQDTNPSASQPAE